MRARKGSPTPLGSMKDDRAVTVFGKLDLHAHYLPDFYQQALARAGHDEND